MLIEGKGEWEKEAEEEERKGEEERNECNGPQHRDVNASVDNG